MRDFNVSDKILIVGGTGFIGRHLVERCLKETPFVTCVGFKARDKKSPFMQDIEYIQTDITNKVELQSALFGRNFDYVFNLGGYIDHSHYFNGGRQMIETHFVGLMNLIDCIDRTKLKGFVQIGSSDEYGNAPAPQGESIRERPIAPYSFAKTAASHFVETLYRTQGFPGVVIRLFLIYGPGQDGKRFLPQIIKAFLKDESVETTEGMQLRDFCYIEDGIEGIVKAAVTNNAKGKIINVASGMPITIRGMIEKTVAIVGKGKPVFGARPYRKGESMELYADISLAKSLFDWEPCVGLDDGLKRTIDYYKKENK